MMEAFVKTFHDVCVRSFFPIVLDFCQYQYFRPVSASDIETHIVCLKSDILRSSTAVQLHRYSMLEISATL